MSGNMYVGGNAVANDYGDYAQEGGHGAGEDTHCCEHSTRSGGGIYQTPVHSRQDSSSHQGERGGGEEAVWVMDPSTGYLVSVPAARGNGDGYEGSFGGTGSDHTAAPLPVPMPGSDFGGGAPIVSDAEGNLFVQGIDGNLYPIDMPGEGGEAVSGEGGSHGSGGVEPDPTTGLLTEVDGVVVPLTPELAREIGREQIQTMALDGRLDPERAALLLPDPAAHERTGIVVQAANEVSGGSVEFVERAADVFVNDTGSNAEQLIAQMLGNHLNGADGGIDAEAFAELANDDAFLAELESMLQPDANGRVSKVSVDLATEKVLMKANPEQFAVEPLPTPYAGDAAPDADAATTTAPGAASDIPPEDARYIGAEYLQSLAGNDQVLAPDGRPSAEREALVTGESDPAVLQMIGTVYDKAFRMALETSGGDRDVAKEYAARAADVFVTDVGTSLGNADKFVSAMLRESLADGGDFSVEQFVELAHDGEFLTELLGLLQPGEDGAVPPENLRRAQQLFAERTGIESAAPTDAPQGTTDPETGTPTDTATAASVDDAASDSGDTVVEQQYFAALVDRGTMTAEEARALMGDEGFMSSLQPFLQVDGQGVPVDPQGAIGLTEDALAVLRNGDMPASDDVAGGETVADGEGVAPSGDTEVPDGATLAARFLEEGDGPLRELMIGQGVAEEVADEALASLAGDEEYMTDLTTLLTPDEQGQVAPEAVEQAKQLTVQTLREKVGEIVNERDGDASEGASEQQTAEQQQQEAQQFVEGGGEVGDFLGLGEGQGEQLGGGAYDAYSGFFGENTNFAQGGAGIDQVAGGFGLDTNGAFGNAGTIYEGAETIFADGASTGDIVNGALQVGVGGYEFGKSIGLWGGDGGDDDVADFEDDLAEFDVGTPTFDTEDVAGNYDFAENYDYDLDSLETDTDFSDSAFDTDFQLDTSINTDMADFEIAEDTEFTFSA